MPPPRRIYLDTNFFIAMLEPADEALAAQLTRLYSLNDGSIEPFLATSELTLAELLVGPYKGNNGHLIRTYENMFTPGGVLEVGPIDRNVLKQAARLRALQPQLKLPDAIHIATAQAHQCSHFLTYDLRVSIADAPVNKEDAASQIEVMQPTMENVGFLIEAFSK